jgi:hypothetical protein
VQTLPDWLLASLLDHEGQNGEQTCLAYVPWIVLKSKMHSVKSSIIAQSVMMKTIHTLRAMGQLLIVL